MAQFNWVYLSDNGKRHNIGLFHGDRTGHLMVHCNMRVVLIDFSVRSSAKYSFFLDDDLCEIIIEQKGDKFSYGFEINKEVDTPKNRHRKSVDRKEWRQAFLFFGIFIALVALTAFFLVGSNRGFDKKSSLTLTANSPQSVARVFILDQKGDTLQINYSFIAGERPVECTAKVISPLGPVFPLESGDEFRVSYSPQQPAVNAIDFRHPVEEQLKRYFQRTLKRHLDLNPSVTRDQAQCLINIAFELKSLEGLADFFFQNAAPDVNPMHNEITYKRLIRDIPFTELKEKRCW
ncbi:MAG: hypothetical protein H6562_03730 [Lewinellaceae bacterium]|nr:hypothetical protein [Lewinella sp.]MCB9277994.1 hypothetical protein [Lewinellaceae bacterium]